MLRRHTLLALALLLGLLIFPSRQSEAQGLSALAAGDHALILSNWLPVHTQPDVNSPIVTEMAKGTVSRVVTTQTDADGLVWVYLTYNAYGWVPSVINGETVVTLSSDEVLDAIIEPRDEDNVDSLIARAAVYQSRKQYDLAIQDAKSAIALNPDDMRLQEYLGDIYLDAGTYDLAISELEAVIMGDHILAGTYNRLGVAYLNSDDVWRAIGFYQLALELTPEYGLIYSNLANAELQVGLGQGALDHYGEAIERDPYLSTAYSNRGILYQNRGDYDAALADFNKALEIDPYLYDAYINRADIYIDNLSRPADGLADANAAIELEPDTSDGYVLRALAYEWLHEFDLAITDFKTAIALNPNDDNALYNLAVLYGLSGRYADCVEAYNGAMSVATGSHTVNPIIYRAQCQIAAGQYDQIVDDLDIYLGMGYTQDFMVMAYMLRGETHLYLRDYRAAADDYTHAFQTWEEMAVNYDTYGAGYRITRQREYLIPDLNAQVQEHPDDRDLRLQIGNLFMEYGRWDEGITSYQRALDLQPDEDLEYFVETLLDLLI